MVRRHIPQTGDRIPHPADRRPHPGCNVGQRGAVVYVLLALIALVFLGFSLYALRSAMMSIAAPPGPAVPSATTSNAPFVQRWSVGVGSPFVLEMAAVPGHPGQFFALHRQQVLRFDSGGARVSAFEAPPKSSRIATDPTGNFPHVMVVSSRSKWTGAIDHKTTTDYFLHALDKTGRELWQKRFDPNDVATLEPVPARVMGQSLLLLSASKRIFCFDAVGRELWQVPLWHHPYTVTGIEGEILAADVIKKQIVRLGGDGRVAGPWGKAEGLRRFRTMSTRAGTYGISLRDVYGGGAGRRVVTFFHGGGGVIREVDLPRDAGFGTYWPIVSMDLDGRGHRAWVVALGDGTIFVYSPDGEQLARHSTGARLKTMFAVMQSRGPDLLVTAGERDLRGWQPVAARIQGPR